MLHILLLILKIIGIIIVAVTAILLLVILTVLFVPVRYRITAEGGLGRKEPVRAKISVNWLFHIVNAAFSYPEAAYLKVRIFCFCLLDSSKSMEGKSAETEHKTDKEYKQDKKNPEQTASEIKTEPAETVYKTETEPGAGEEAAENKNEEQEKHDRQEKNEGQEENDRQEKTGGQEENDRPEKTGGQEENDRQEKTESQEKNGIRGFLQALINVFKRFLQALTNIQYTIREICDKIKKITENIRYYTEVLKSEVFQAAFGVSRSQLIRILKAVRPKTCSINLKTGTGDPASTGQIVAFYGILYPFIGNGVCLQADFENKVLEGDLYIKGKITAFTFLFVAFRLYTDKNIRQLIQMLKREDA